MRAAVYYPSNGIRIEEQPVPKIGPGEILLKVRACGVCGTDVLKVSRALPEKPVVLGHELVGDVVDTGAHVSKFNKNDRIVVAHHVPCGSCHYCEHGNHSMCRSFKKSNLDPGGFCEFLRVPSSHVLGTAFPVPERLSDDEALFTEPLACCVRNIRRAKLLPEDTVVVVGMGSIGLMMVQLLKLIPARVIALDLKEERLELAKSFGANHVLFGNDPGLTETLMSETSGRGADLIIFTAGSERTLQESIRWVRDGGALNLFASLSDEPVPLSLDLLYHREITLFSSYSPSPEDLRQAHHLLSEGEVKVKPLVTHHLPLEELEKGIELMREQKALKVIVRPSS